MTVDELVRFLALSSHPEGGFYRETYRSTEIVATPRGPRASSTAILFLLRRGDFSALHRLASDELWHFYGGTPIRLVSLLADARRVDHVLGPNVGEGEHVQVVVAAGAWFGARLERDGEWALAGCTVAPGFDFADFELGGRGDLLALYPQHAEVVRALTR